jgi:hypothetical protein
MTRTGFKLDCLLPVSSMPAIVWQGTIACIQYHVVTMILVLTTQQQSSIFKLNLSYRRACDVCTQPRPGLEPVVGQQLVHRNARVQTLPCCLMPPSISSSISALCDDMGTYPGSCLHFLDCRKPLSHMLFQNLEPLLPITAEAAAYFHENVDGANVFPSTIPLHTDGSALLWLLSLDAWVARAIKGCANKHVHWYLVYIYVPRRPVAFHMRTSCYRCLSPTTISAHLGTPPTNTEAHILYRTGRKAGSRAYVLLE